MWFKGWLFKFRGQSESLFPSLFLTARNDPSHGNHRDPLSHLCWLSALVCLVWWDFSLLPLSLHFIIGSSVLRSCDFPNISIPLCPHLSDSFSPVCLEWLSVEWLGFSEEELNSISVTLNYSLPPSELVENKMHDDEALTFSENEAFSSHNTEWRSESVPSLWLSPQLMSALAPQREGRKKGLQKLESFIFESFIFVLGKKKIKPFYRIQNDFIFWYSFEFHLAHRADHSAWLLPMC